MGLQVVFEPDEGVDYFESVIWQPVGAEQAFGPGVAGWRWTMRTRIYTEDVTVTFYGLPSSVTKDDIQVTHDDRGILKFSSWEALASHAVSVRKNTENAQTLTMKPTFN